jgi:hypothetical protein
MFTDADFEEKIDAAVAVSGEFLPPPGAQFEGQLVRLRFFRDEAEIGEKVNIYGPKTRRGYRPSGRTRVVFIWR